MYLFQRLLERLRQLVRRERTFALDFKTLESLRVIAEKERRSETEMAVNLVQEAVQARQRRGMTLFMWSSLSPREQEVAGLICLHYTNRQIASRLHISPETVKTHVAHVLTKFGVTNRQSLRVVLAEWDFSEWDDET